LAVVWRFTGSALVGVGAGYWIDKHFGVAPAGLVVGGLLGSGVGFYAFIRGATQLLDAQSKSKSKPKGK
jgi:F0F1-type ATP synthase assembly protein I